MVSKTSSYLFNFLTQPYSSSSFAKLPFGSTAHINVSFVFAVVYMTCYIIMEPLAGSLGAGLVGTIYLYSGHLVAAGTQIQGLILNKLQNIVFLEIYAVILFQYRTGVPYRSVIVRYPSINFNKVGGGKKFQLKSLPLNLF